MPVTRKIAKKAPVPSLSVAAWRACELAAIQCLVARARARAELALASAALHASRSTDDPAEAAVRMEQARQALVEAKRASLEARIHDAEARERGLSGRGERALARRRG